MTKMFNLAFLVLTFIFLILAVASPAAERPDSKTKKGAPKSSPQKPRTASRPLPPPPPVLDSITLPDGERIPAAEIVPRAESAEQDLQQILNRLGGAQIAETASSSAELNDKVTEALPDAEDNVRRAHSALRLREIRVLWDAYASQLKILNTTATNYGSMIDQRQQQVAAMRKKWTLISETATAAGAPADLLEHVTRVQSKIEVVEESIRPQLESLIQLQVQILDTRAKIQKIVDEINIADNRIREQIFVLDSPALWSRANTFGWAATKQQAGQQWASFVHRAGQFLHVSRSGALAYLFVVLIALLAMMHLTRHTPITGLEVPPASLALLQHPMLITCFLALAAFGALFQNAPVELTRLCFHAQSGLTLALCLRLPDQAFRKYVIGVVAIYLSNGISSQLISGTFLRRLLIQVFVSVLLAAMFLLLRKGGVLRERLAQRQSFFLSVIAHLAWVVLAVACLCNVLGNTSLADLLTNGVIISTYWALVAFVLYAILRGLMAWFVFSDIAKRSRLLRVHSQMLDRKFASLLNLGAWSLWLVALMVSFQISGEAYSFAGEALNHKWSAGKVSISLLDVVMFFLVLAASSIIAKVIRFVLIEEVFPRTTLDPGIAQAGSRLTYISVIFLGMLFAFGAAGLEPSKLTMLTGAFGVGLGFGLQNVVSNFVSGIILSLERPVRIGDVVEIGELFGQVSAIGFRSSTVRTWDGADVIVPNSDFISKSVVNWSLTDPLRRTEIQIGIAYGTDPNRVLAILSDIVHGHPGVLQSPEALITFDQFGENSLNFTVRFWSKIDDRVKIRSELNILINDALNKAGISIPFPQRDVNLKLDSSITISPAPRQNRKNAAVAGTAE